MDVPEQLQDPNFRFFLIGNNSKLPIEKSWNKSNCYPFFHEKLIAHKGNYGVCTGYGNLIVLDFDEIDFYNTVAGKLPPTFTILSAGKRLPHMYYLLEGDMFKKIAIMDQDKKVLCDIQADRVGVVGPGSKIDRKYYNVANNKKIAQISFKELTTVFDIKPKYRKEYTGPTIDSGLLVDRTIVALHKLGIKRTGGNNYQCPFHDSNNEKSLTVLPNGRIYCFHEQKVWFTMDEFVVALQGVKNGKKEE